MVLSLADICLRSAMIGVENGTIRNVHYFVPLRYRQSFLNMVLARGKINNPIWLRELSCQEFLRGMSSLNTRCGRADDEEYLRSVARSIYQGGEAIGAGIKELKLNLYRDGDEGDIFIRAINLGGIVRLISQCPNLRSLAIRTEQICGYDPFPIICHGLLNRSESTKPCLAVLENIEELALTGVNCGEQFLSDDYPIIKFKKLTSLRLVSGAVDVGRWKDLLNFVGGTLTHLHLTQVYGLRSSSSSLPVPLPQLKELKIYGYCRCDSSFVANLQQCTKLEHIYLAFDLETGRDAPFTEDDESLMALNRIKADLEVAINFYCYETDGFEMLDGDSRFKLVPIFNEKITRFALNAYPWTPRYTSALENIVDVCQNLTSFALKSSDRFGETWFETEKVNSVLARLFGDSERASKLRELELDGEIGFEILTLIFENCSNLDSLDIDNNVHLGDVHLIRWAERGAAPSRFMIDQCPNVTDEGLAPILINSGNRLTQFGISSLCPQINTERLWRVLIDHCPNIRGSYRIPRNLKALVRSKCFNIHPY